MCGSGSVDGHRLASDLERTCTNTPGQVQANPVHDPGLFSFKIWVIQSGTARDQGRLWLKNRFAGQSPTASALGTTMHRTGSIEDHGFASSLGTSLDGSGSATVAVLWATRWNRCNLPYWM
ncbi:uncharacterized protein LOC120426053 isoform X1 [Culex pipiens pallens]|uniref:uncharacterized protein LOC120426053 isoform X1 n=1 Tax=Culex pipiens pallens TaxID=42434 RepID=UPI0022AA3AFC|nr:uncharacterized protein LOC120426053 isoform X1 [Culex pipiens pallens]